MGIASISQCLNSYEFFSCRYDYVRLQVQVDIYLYFQIGNQWHSKGGGVLGAGHPKWHF